MTVGRKEKLELEKAVYREKLGELARNLPPRFVIIQTDKFLAHLVQISQDDLELSFQVRATLIKLRHDPFYKGLQSHVFKSLSTSKKQVFESYVQNNTSGAYRLFWHYGPKEQSITILFISQHS